MMECVEGGWEGTGKYQRCRQPSWLQAGTWSFRCGGCLEDRWQGRGQDGIGVRGGLSLQFLHGSVFPHSPLCSGAEAPIVPRTGGPGHQVLICTLQEAAFCVKVHSPEGILYSAAASDQSSALALPPSGKEAPKLSLKHKIHFHKGGQSNNSSLQT